MNNREKFPNLLNALNLRNKGVELGAFKGEFSRTILNRWMGTLYMVDVWRELDKKEYDDQSNHEFHTDAYLAAMNNVKPFSERAHMLRCRGNVAAELFRDSSLDFVYIDANHTYESVVEDITTWYPKIKSGGVLAGHDYLKLEFPAGEKNIPLLLWNEATPEKQNYAGMFGVNPAVDEFVDREGYDLNVTDEFLGTWWIIKR